MKKFNINDDLFVKLTDYGYDIWLKYKYFNYKGITTTIEKLKEKEDEDGYVRFQAWCFMEIFGTRMGMGFEQIIENNIILLSEKDLKNHISSVKMMRRKKLKRLVNTIHNNIDKIKLSENCYLNIK